MYSFGLTNAQFYDTIVVSHTVCDEVESGGSNAAQCDSGFGVAGGVVVGDCGVRMHEKSISFVVDAGIAGAPSWRAAGSGSVGDDGDDRRHQLASSV